MAFLDTSLPAYPTTPRPKVKSAPVVGGGPSPATQNALTAEQGAITGANSADAKQAAAIRTAGEANVGVQNAKIDFDQGLRAKEQAELAPLDQGPFKPEKPTLASMGALFTMVAMVGAFLGSKGGTSAAANAQAALTGMVKGWNDGNEELVRQQKAVYDTNAAYLKDKADKVRQLIQEYREDAVKDGIPTALGRFAQNAKTRADADVLASVAEKQGPERALKLAEDTVKAAEAQDSKQQEFLQSLYRQDRGFAHADAQKKGQFTPEMGALMAALAEKGVSLPVGLRSQQQQAALYEGLLARHPNMSPDEIANAIKGGKIDITAELKETGTAAGIAGRVDVAQRELAPMGDLLVDAIKKVPRGSFLPVNKLLAATETQLTDPNLRALKVRINSYLNAYDVLSARGGTDVEKRKANHALISEADSPEALISAVNSINQEGAIAEKAATGATHKYGGGGKPAPTAKDRDWVQKHPGDRQKFIDHFGIEP